MNARLSVAIDTEVLRRLIAHVGLHGGASDLGEAVDMAIEQWLNQSAGAGPGTQAEDTGRGYLWKDLFLPEGTMVRSWSAGSGHLAKVEGDRLVHAGQAVTPNQFAQSYARSTRNAWTALSVRRPGDKIFRLACVLRRELNEAGHAHDMQRGPSAPAWSAPAANRDTTPGPGWTLPERRSHRYRLEDVAFE